MKPQIPKVLLFSRLVIGLTMVVLSSFHIRNYQTVAKVLLTTGLLTDIFDGIIARQLNISTQKFRRLDSTIDQVFFVSAAVATYIQCPDFFTSNVLKLIILTGAEALTYLTSFLSSGKKLQRIQLEPRFGVCYCLRHLFKSFYNANQAFCLTFAFGLGY